MQNLDEIPVTRDNHHAHVMGEIVSSVLGEFKHGADTARAGGSYRPTTHGTVKRAMDFVWYRRGFPAAR